MRNPIGLVVERLQESDRYGGISPHLLPYAVPGLAEMLERIEPTRRAASRPQSIAELQTVITPKKIEQFQYCPLCGADALRLMYRPVRYDDEGKLHYRYKAGRCAECGLLQRTPGIKPTRVPDLYTGGGYAEFLTGKYLKGRRDKYERTMRSFAPFLDEGAGRRLLDFGCGTGEFLDMALERGFDAYGVDLAPDSIELARQRFGDRAWCGSPLDVPALAEGGFDVITLWSVIAHFADPLEQLQQLRSLLAPGGALLVYTVNAQSLELKAYRHDWGCFDENHLLFWEPETLTPLLRKAGFEGVAYRPFYGKAIENGTWKLDQSIADRLVAHVDRYQSGNMMRAIAVNSPSDPVGIGGLRRL